MKPFRLWIYRLLTSWMPETRFFGLKAALLRWCGATIGQNVRINSSAVFVGNGRLSIGDDVWIGAGDVISPIAPVEIVLGSHIDLGPQVMILTGSHEIDPNGEHIGGKGKEARVEIGDGCWLGARSTILPGVVLPRKTLVAAGAVVVKDVLKEKSLVAGVPAKIMRSL